MDAVEAGIGVVMTDMRYRCGPTAMSMFCRASTGRIGNLPRSIDEYSGVNSLTSCPAACRYLVSAEDTSARPPVFDRGAASDAMRQTVRVIMRLPVYDVGQSA